MARKHGFLIGLLSDFIRRNPRTSASIAFNLGVYAALATKRGLAKNDLQHLPGKLVDLVPSMKDLGSYVPTLAAGKTRPARLARKPAARRATKRRAR